MTSKLRCARQAFEAALRDPETHNNTEITRLIELDREIENQLHPVPDFGPDFSAVELLAQGGMGSVYRAKQDNEYGRIVAIKAMNLQLSSQRTRLRFEIEAELLATLSHPNICRYFGSGVTTTGSPFVIMEYISGSDLLHYANQAGLSTRARIDLFIQLLHAVSYAHAHFVLHRDLKTSNILVDSSGRVVLLDFGIAKNLRQHSSIHFTEPFMSLENVSPEQLLNTASLSTQTDIHQLGGLLYRLLTNQHFYAVDKEAFAATVQQISQGDPELPSRRYLTTTLSDGCFSEVVHKQLQGDLDWILLKCLARQAEDRYPSVNQLTSDLQAWRELRPISIRPNLWLYRTAKFVQRNRSLINWLVPTFAITAALLSLAIIQSRTIQDKQVIAETATARSEALAEVFTSAFEAADPLVAGAQLSARDILSSTAAIVTRGGPATLELRPEIASVQLKLGMVDAAEALLEHSALSDDYHSLTLRAQIELQRGQQQQAEALLQQAVAHADYSQAPARADTVHMLLLQVRGQRREALLMLQGLIAQASPDELPLLYIQLAQAHKSIGALEAALAAVNQSLMVSDELQSDAIAGKAHLEASTILRRLNQPEASLRHAQQAVDLLTGVYGRGSLASAGAITSLATAKIAYGDFAAAIQLLDTSSETYAARLGRTSPRFLMSEYNRANALLKLTRYQEALAVLEPVVQSAQLVWTQDANLGYFYLAAGSAAIFVKHIDKAGRYLSAAADILVDDKPESYTIAETYLLAESARLQAIQGNTQLAIAEMQLALEHMRERGLDDDIADYQQQLSEWLQQAADR